MKIELLDIDKMVDVNKLEVVSSPRLFSSKMVYDPEGILSTDIFGISKNDRRGTFAYVELKRPFIHPHIYGNVLKRVFRKIIYIISGQRKYSINNGEIIEDENGWTGITELYNHWDEINWDTLNSANDRSITLLKNTSRDEVFITKMLISPPAYRDVTIAGTIDNSDHVQEVNELYMKLIRAVSLLQEGGLFARTQYATQMKVQEILINISDYYKNLISKKSGLIKKNLIGKSVDYGTRAVISAFNFNNETLQENMVDIDHCALPISQCCSTFYPFIESWLMNFFTREIINNPNLVSYYDNDEQKEVQAVLENVEMQFSEKSIKKMINNYIFNPDNRFSILKVQARVPETDKLINASIILKGKIFLPNNVMTTLNRPMTITDVLYLACTDVCEKRHVMVSRYPVGTDKGIFFNKIRVQSTIKHIKVIFNDKEYQFYPLINLGTPHNRVGIQFVDSFVYANSLLEAMGADYDGDQVSIRGLWTDEANLEAEFIMHHKMTALNIAGGNSRQVSREIYNSYYELTKKLDNGKTISLLLQEQYLSMTGDEYTRSFISGMFADLANATSDNPAAKRKAKHKTWDTITIPENYFYDGQEETITTIGSFLFNKYVLQSSGIIQNTKLVLNVIDKKGLGTLDSLVGDLYLNDIITRDQFNDYTNRRDNLGYWLNGMLAHTISFKMLQPLKEVEKRKKELYKQYEKEIAAGDIDVMIKISDELVKYAKEILQDDPGMNLYSSGDLDFGNNYKSNSILKGPVMNNITKEFDFVGSSFMDGIDIKDLPAHANSILSAQYPTSIATKDSGYMGKRLLALLQMMSVDEPGTDCGTKKLIPVTITNFTKKYLVYSYIEVENQLTLLTPGNIDAFVGKRVMMRSPATCLTDKICSKCAGELFNMLDVSHAGLYSVQISHSALNLALKAKHNQLIMLYQIDPETIIQDL